MISVYIVIAAAVIVLPIIFLLGYYGGMKSRIDGLEAAEDRDEPPEPHPLIASGGYKYSLSDVSKEDSEQEESDEE